jgi:signal transduction histidine kinase
MPASPLEWPDVTAHGGDVTVDRYPGNGARFTLRLPALADPTM